MDQRERIDDRLVALRAAFSGWQSQIWTALPAAVVSYDATKRTVSLQPTIQAQIQNAEGTWTNASLPVLEDCPVVFPGGGGFELTFPIAAGDEGIVVFASRCIDAWWQNSGVQPQAELRMHDLSDGMFIPGMFSQARKPAVAPSGSVPQLRNAAGTVVLEFISGGMKLTGNLQVTGSIIGGFGGIDQVGLQTHLHAANNTPPTTGT